MRTTTLVSLIVMTVLLLMSVPIGAQQPVAPPPPQIPYGAPISLEQAKKALAFCIENLNDTDRFEVIRFSTDTEPVFQKLTDATPAARKRAHDFVRNLKPTGGTAIDWARSSGTQGSTPAATATRRSRRESSTLPARRRPATSARTRGCSRSAPRCTWQRSARRG